MNWALWTLLFVLLGTPTAMLMLDRMRNYPANEFLRTGGIPALPLFVVLTICAALIGDPIVEPLLWGFIGGIAATLALDAVRLVGVRFRAFPMDMPSMFGLLVLGPGSRFQINLLASMVARVAHLPPGERRAFMAERLEYLSRAPAAIRRTMVAGIMKGLSHLPEEEAQAMRSTQVELLAQLPGEFRKAILATMDEITLGMAKGGPPRESMPRVASPRARMPQIPMGMFFDLAAEAFPETLSEERVSRARVLSAGYLWHFVNGASYGMAFTLLFGHGSWALALAWGLFVWAVMMISMPRMMPMVKFPFPRFLLVPFVAHIAMALAIGYFAITFVTPGGHASSLVGGLGLEWLVRALGLG